MSMTWISQNLHNLKSRYGRTVVIKKKEDIEYDIETGVGTEVVTTTAVKAVLVPKSGLIRNVKNNSYGGEYESFQYILIMSPKDIGFPVSKTTVFAFDGKDWQIADDMSSEDVIELRLRAVEVNNV